MKRTVEVQMPEDQVNQAATMFIKTANEFTSYILVTRNGNSVNAKSLLGFLSLGMRSGVEAELSAEGEDDDIEYIDDVEDCIEDLDDFEYEEEEDE